MESLKLWASALMGARKPDGSIDWMMTGFVWIFTLLVLFIVIGIPIIVANKKKKSKFGASDKDTGLVILIRSGNPENIAFEQSAGAIDQLHNLAMKSTGNGIQMVSFEQDASLGDTTQLVYMGGIESLFGNTPGGTLLGTVSNGLYGLDMYTRSSTDYKNAVFQFASADAQPNAAVKPLLGSNMVGTYTYVQDTSIPAGTTVLRLLRFGIQPPRFIGDRWFNEFSGAPFEVYRFPTTQTKIKDADFFNVIFPAIEAKRAKRPEPIVKPVFLIKCQPDMKLFADVVAERIKNDMKDAFTADVHVEPNSTEPFVSVILVSFETNIKSRFPISDMTLPLVLVHAPVRLLVVQGDSFVFEAFKNSFVTYNNTLKRLSEQETPKDRSGPLVIRLEGDVDPLLLRGRVELLNLLGEKQEIMPLSVKYTKTKNTKRPVGTLSVYVESFDPVRLRTILDGIGNKAIGNNAVYDKIIKEAPSGTYLGNMETYQVINGTGDNNPLTLSERTTEASALIWINFIMYGTGQKPNEDTLLTDLGCHPAPEPTPCPSCPPPPPPTVCPPPPPPTVCPPEKICPTPAPCPSCPPEKICTTPAPCPFWDPTKKAPVGNDIMIYSNTGVSNRTRILPALVEPIRIRLALVGKTANFTYPTANSGTNGVNVNTIRIKFKSYNKTFGFPTTDATMRTFVDTIVADLTPLLA